MNFFQFGKGSIMNLEVVIIFEEQISKEQIPILAANLYISSGDKSIKISYGFQEKDKELDSQELPCRLYSIYNGQFGFIN